MKSLALDWIPGLSSRGSEAHRETGENVGVVAVL